MTETLQRPARPMPRPPRRPVAEDPGPSPRTAGLVAALTAAVAGLLVVVLPVLLVWGTDDRSGVDAGEAVRSGARLWLLAHGVSLDVPGGRVSLTPLALLALPLALLARSTAAAVRRTGARPVRVALWTAGPYALLALGASLLVSGPDVHVSPVLALLGGAVTGLLGALAGALRPDGLWRSAFGSLSRRTRRLVRAAGGALAVLVGAAALLVGGSLVLHFPQAVELAGASAPGPVGGAALLLTCLLLVPNALLWSASWLAGPGFAVGAGTAVGPFAHELGPVPALPLLAALPSGGAPEWVAVLVLAVPLLAGAVAGRTVVTDLRADLPSAGRTAGEAALAGPVTGVLVGLLAWLSGGAVGGDRLVGLGPSPWRTGLAVAACVAVGAVAAALVRRRRLLDAAADPRD